MATISFSEPLKLNALVWIRSIPDDELGITRRILEDLEDLTLGGGFPVFEYEVANRQELFAVLDDIAAKSLQGLRPILHLDAHGNQQAGLHLTPGDQWAAWPELLEKFRAINIATDNNLVVVLALCYGLELYKLVELKEAAPAYLFAAPPEKVKLGFLFDHTAAFYRQVAASGAFLDAFAATLGQKLELMNCQGIFLRALAHYVLTQCRGSALEERVTRTIPKILQRDGITEPSPEQLEAAETAVREFLTPGQKLIDHFAPHFLSGRAPLFTFEDVAALAGLPAPDPKHPCTA